MKLQMIKLAKNGPATKLVKANFTPEATEYALYYKPYIEMVADQNVMEVLKQQLDIIPTILDDITEEKGNFCYAEGKWSVKELLLHVLDTDRVMAYRALCIARGEKNPLPGFDENLYAENSGAKTRELDSIIEEFEMLRMSNLTLFHNFTPEILKQVGNANGKDISVRALLYIIAGHTAHHINVLQERYLS